MNLTENFRVALRALASNKLRSSLTMLGIIIGVGAVVALMAIGNGATASITEQVQGIGSNLISVAPGRFQQGGQSTQGALYLDDYEALFKGLTNIAGIAPVLQTGATVTYDRETLSTSITATTPDFASVRAYEVARGRFLNQTDRDREARVAVIGAQTAKDLFGGLNPVARKIKINGISFEVVGVLKEKGSSGFGSADEIILVPLETGYAKLAGAQSVRSGKKTLNSIQFSAASAEVVNDVTATTERILRREHKLGLNEEADFSVQSQTQFLSTLSNITTTLTLFLGAIAGISLLVGGVGIMNIMLVSVTERTREIGLRKAVGAKQMIILLQFLVETLVLSLIGGLLGIGLGWGIAAGVTAANLIQAQVTSSSVMLAFSFAAAVGVFFGLYPAYRASRLRPIEALRYE